MSGCIEIRELDLEDPTLLPQALEALDRFMAFYSMMGFDIVRLRELLDTAPQDVPEDIEKVLSEHGYVRMGAMFAKGSMVLDRHPWEDVLSFILWKQHIDPKRRFTNVVEAIKTVGGLRSDAAAALRCKNRIPLKKMFEMGFLVRVQAIPDYVTYCSLEFASLCRRAKDREITDDMAAVIQTIAENKPLSRNQLFDRSPLGHRGTHDALKALNSATITYVDQNKRVRLVPPIALSATEARKEIVRHCFRNFGLFTAENLARFMRFELPMKELRNTLAELERDGFLAKGFLVEGDENVYWVVREDLERIGKVKITEKFVLGPEDALHTYLSERIRQDLGGSYHSLVMDGPRVVGSFWGRIKATDMMVQNFKGEGEARLILNRYLRSLGLTVRVADNVPTVPDWEVQAFYEKTHPGEV